MAANNVTMMQGDSRLVPFSVSLNGVDVVASETAQEIEICVGNEDGVLIRKTLSGGDLTYELATRQWYFRLSQEETLGLEPDIYEVIARVKVGEDVFGVKIGRITIQDTQSEEVI